MQTINHNEFLQQFEAHLVDSALAPATVVNYVADLRTVLRWSERAKGAEQSPFDLDEVDVQGYCSFLQETRSQVPATINRRLQALRKFFDFAIVQGWTHTNPAADVPLLSEVVSDRTRSLTPGDVARLLAAVQRSHSSRVERDWAIMQVLLEGGVKLSELTELRLTDLYLDRNPPCLIVADTPAQSERMIPLDSEVSDALRTYLLNRQAAPGVDRLFVNRDGREISTRSVQRLLRRYAKAAGLDTLCVTTQSLRYVYARKALTDNGDLKAVARLLGHRHLATTIRYLRPCLPQGQRPDSDCQEQSKPV